jgi:hypothetical protein
LLPWLLFLLQARSSVGVADSATSGASSRKLVYLGCFSSCLRRRRGCGEARSSIDAAFFNIPGRFPVPASGDSLRFVIPLSCGRVDLVRIPRDAFSICNAALACDARLLLWLSAGAGVLFFFRLRVDGRWSFSSHKASFGFLLLVPDLVLILAMIEWFLVWH